MITVLGGQDVREESCACDAAFDRSACCGGLHDLRTARAGELRSNVPNDLELLRHALEDLTHILTQVPELAAATWAGRRIVGPHEADHAPRSLAVAGTLRIAAADRFSNSLEPALYPGHRSGSIPVRHELLEISDPLLHHLRLNRLVQARQDVGELGSDVRIDPA
jgi:hypothetical protein